MKRVSRLAPMAMMKSAAEFTRVSISAPTVPAAGAPAVAGFNPGGDLISSASNALSEVSVPRIAIHIFAERQDGTLTLRRGFSLAPIERVVVIEDVVTTGLSTRETIACASAAGATVVGAGSIIDRSGGRADLATPFRSLATYVVANYEPTECPMCAAGEPVTKPGSRA